MAKKSGGGAGEVIHETRRFGGEEVDYSRWKNELEAERKKACELVRQRNGTLKKVLKLGNVKNLLIGEFNEKKLKQIVMINSHIGMWNPAWSSNESDRGGEEEKVEFWVTFEQ